MFFGGKAIMAFWNVGKKQPVGQPDEPAVVDEFEIHDYIGGLAEFNVTRR